MQLALLAVLLTLLLAGWTYWIAATVCLKRLLHPPRPLDAVANNHCGPGTLPLAADARCRAVSVLKPVRGLDANAWENFSSLCRQTLPPREILFGVETPDDPAVEMIRRLQQHFPSAGIRLLICPPAGCANRKVNTLAALAKEAVGDLLVIADADIGVSSDYLRQVTLPLANAAVGLVSCPYVAVGSGLAAAMEALYIAGTFLPNVAVATALKKTVGLGATMAMRACDLKRLGGMEAIGDCLLDDYALAQRFRQDGMQVCISTHVVHTTATGTLKSLWQREVRWARGIRAATPARDYVGMAATFSLLWAAVLVLAAGLAWWAWLLLAATVALRAVVALAAGPWAGQPTWRLVGLVPLRDLLTAAAWVAGFGRRIDWRGSQYLLRRDGGLVPVQRAELKGGLFSRAVYWLDARLRRQQQIFEFSTDPRCLLRMNHAHATEALCLSDGTAVAPGDAIGELHLWNEHVPRIPAGGPTLGWSSALYRQMQHTLRLLAQYAAEGDPAMPEAFHARTVFLGRHDTSHAVQIARRLGFQQVLPPGRPTFLQRLHDRGEDMLIWALVRVYNPVGLRGKGFRRPRQHLWITRNTLLNRYLHDKPAAVKRAAPLHLPQQHGVARAAAAREPQRASAS